MGKQVSFRHRGIGLALLAAASLGPNTFSQDPNFHIYLAFGQSNMEGNGPVPAEEKTGVNPRFQVMAAVNCPGLGRTKGQWYTAVPPLCRCGTGMTPADYFGRTLVDSLPANVKVGVINVSVAGCSIRLFDKDNYQSYLSGAPDWLKSIANEYGGNPYAHLVQLAKQAQQAGVIKGFLLHQGETDGGNPQWANMVKVVYDNLIKDLGLDASKTPLLAGDLVTPSTMVQRLPSVLPNSHVISSQGLKANGDNLHFSPEGYRDFGKRYAATMLTILARDPTTGIRDGQSSAGYVLEQERQGRGPGASLITFEVPRRTFVSLRAYTLDGRDLAELAGRVYPAGRHTVDFGRQALPTGLSVLEMKADTFTATRKILVGAR
jgi:hypothetical protein